MIAPPPGGLRIEQRAADSGRLVLELVGDLDYDTAEQLGEDVLTALDTPGLTALALDCAGLGGCDSMGLAVLLQVRRHTDRAGVRLTLERPPVSLRRLLGLTGTSAHFGVEPV
ncbi:MULTISPECIES: STAS domain-containing protein [unclassified Streptomyces]|uniref:STAS domain-containing protein n=1 Tax=unclassified Streptomyces TaxID=2593676 RepID=UPI00081F3158|nr:MULTISPECIES: STAS domain-containing protein [unclassified Streptomyces]MYR24896.1 STAS domain-containing protein [Streptomyces sp. SID4945]SCD91061.1 anti-sigma B factor antagonist [Streptomyces sp. TverLS-915]SCE69821.1 anti-sigma B factor antagonist [Streptomyces sp. LcepLS]